MISKQNSFISFTSSGLILLVLLALISGCWGTPTFKIIFENQTEQDLTIYLGDYEVGNVRPSEQITDRASLDTGKYRIKAIDTQGTIVFSNTLTREQMQKIESRVYKVIIQSSQSDNSNNVTEELIHSGLAVGQNRMKQTDTHFVLHA